MIDKILTAKYPGIDFDDDCVLMDDGAGPYIAAWNRPEPQPTIEELMAWAAENQAAILAQPRKDAIAHIERVFYQLSCEITGEPEITPLLVAEWEEKERLFYDWIEDGQPQPAPDNEYSWAYHEAEQDPVHTGFSLMQEWGRNAIAWRTLQKTFAAYRQARRAAIAAATSEDELTAIRAAIEPELRQLLGVS